jgi:hypothetical protein
MGGVELIRSVESIELLCDSRKFYRRGRADDQVRDRRLFSSHSAGCLNKWASEVGTPMASNGKRGDIPLLNKG